MPKKSYMLAEEGAVHDVLSAEKEPTLHGDLRELIKKQYLSKNESVLLSVGDHEIYDK